MGRFLLSCFMFHVLLLYFPSNTSSLCNHHDSSALLLFKHSLTLDLSFENLFRRQICYSFPFKTESWANDTDCCEWDGVTCNIISGHVIDLDLTCSHLTGKLHPNSSLFQLTYLQRLNLAFNDFNMSPIHSGFGALVNLVYLNLSNSAFSGEIPSTISHLSKLASLDLSYVIRRLVPSTWNKLILNATNLRVLVLEGANMYSIGESSLLLLMNISSSLISLSLAQTGLQGNFPSEILCLPNLQKLSLFYNENLKGELPKTNLSTSLRYLDLSYTAFSGQIPNSIGSLNSLSHLSLSTCKFDGLVPSSLFDLAQLSVLDLSENNFVGPIPSKINKLSKLNTLDFSGNMLNGTIPRWCYSLPLLSELDLGDNQLVGSIGEFTTYSMKYLFLSKNKLQGNFPNSIFEFEDLSYLDLSSNNLSGHVDFHRFSNFKSLFYLILSRNSFLSINFDNSTYDIFPNLGNLQLSSCNIVSFPKFLERLPNLRILDLSHNNIHGNIPKWFHEKLLHSWIIEYINLSFNKLQGDVPIPPDVTYFFSISNNNLTGDISSTMCNARSLIVLNLSHNNLTGMIPQCLGTFPYLSVLDLQMNNLYGSIPRNFSSGNEFETIELNGNRLEGPLPHSLVHCTKLKVLDLANNNLEDTFPTWLETLQDLQVLSLRSNKIHGVITCFTTEQPFPKLRIFDVSNNNFSGPLPTSYIKKFQGMMNMNDNQTGLNYMHVDTFYNDSIMVIGKGQTMELMRILTIFTTIDLSNNMFEGEIPKVIGELNSLIGLNLSHNRITGTIPQSLSNLRNLEWLDLSWNQLTGDIPRALANLNFLSFLNLSQNQLEGIIPIGRQFDTFANDSYGGNPKLCGIPLSKPCNKEAEWPPHSTFDHEESGFGWKAIAVGYACGVIFGMLLGYIVFLTGKPQWLVGLVEGIFYVRLKRLNNRNLSNRSVMN